MKKRRLFAHLAALLGLVPILMIPSHAADKLKALIVDGQNNHEVWPKSTIMMKPYPEDTGLIIVHAADNSWPDWKEFNLMTVTE